MTSLELTTAYPENVRPLPGRCVIEIEPHEDRIGSILIPDVAREQKVTDVFLRGRLVSIGYGRYYEDKKFHSGLESADLEPGQRIVFRALMQDLNKKLILTSVSRIDAVIE